MKKKMTSWLLPLVLVLLLVPCIAVAVSADAPVVYVGGVGMKAGEYLAVEAEEVSEEEPSGGYAYLEEADGKLTLTLNNYCYDGKGYNNSGVYFADDLTINLVENNALTYTTESATSNYCGIRGTQNSDLIIEGAGSLTIDVSSNKEVRGVFVNSANCTINNGNITINVNGENKEALVSTYGIWASGGTVNINDGILNISASVITDYNLSSRDVQGICTSFPGKIIINGGYINIDVSLTNMDGEDKSAGGNCHTLYAYMSDTATGDCIILNDMTIFTGEVGEVTGVASGYRYYTLYPSGTSDDSIKNSVKTVYIEPANTDHKWSTTYSFNEDGHRKYCVTHENCPANNANMLNGYEEHEIDFNGCSNKNKCVDIIPERPQNMVVAIVGDELLYLSEDTAVLNTGYCTIGVPEIAGYAYFKDSTLTLNGFIWNSETPIVFLGNTDASVNVHIELEGINTIIGTDCGITSNLMGDTSALTIDGTGELYIKAPYGILTMNNKITIDGGTIDIQAANCAIGVLADPSQEDPFIVLGENVVIQNPANGTIDSFEIEINLGNGQFIFGSIFNGEAAQNTFVTSLRIVTETPAVEESFPIGNVFRSLRNISFHTAGAGDLNLVRAFGSTVNLTKIQPEPREGYIFTGWYADEALTKPITRIVVTGDVTLYAGWEAIEEEEETEETAAAEAEEAAG